MNRGVLLGVALGLLLGAAVTVFVVNQGVGDRAPVLDSASLPPQILNGKGGNGGNGVASWSAGDPGDLLQVMTSATRVGVLLDEIPSAIVERVAADLLAKPDGWWQVRARKQLGMTMYKLAFLTSFDPTAQQMMLPADDAAIQITFVAPAVRHSMQGHDVVSRPYTIQTYLVTAPGTAVQAQAALGQLGGQYVVKWSLPLDPFLLYQRTGYACADEDQFPHNSLDSEAVESYYDDTCTAGPAVPATQECLGEITGCHCTFGATLDCVDALRQFVGSVHMSMTFVRVSWDESIAGIYEGINSYRTEPGATGADLVGYPAGMAHNWIVYRYFEPTSCEALECLSGGGGWRKLLIFDSIHVNVGIAELLLGQVSYKAHNASSFNQASLRNQYYWSDCHEHPHFSQYCKYEYATSLIGHKQGFCIQSTNRIVNGRTTSLVSPYQNCSYQGISVGWADNYNGGIPCQWVEITAQNTGSGGVVRNLTMIGNPSDWLCEGTVHRNPDGSPQWVPTGSVTTSPPYPVAGLPIDIFNCTASPGALGNNVDNLPVYDPVGGQGLLTGPCAGGQIFGPKRDCEFVDLATTIACTPGAIVSLNCSSSGSSVFSVIRVCEASIALGVGTACRFNDDFTLANVVLPPGATTTIIPLQCPAARDAVEIGGRVALYAASLYNSDIPSTIACALAKP